MAMLSQQRCVYKMILTWKGRMIGGFEGGRDKSRQRIESAKAGVTNAGFDWGNDGGGLFWGVCCMAKLGNQISSIINQAFYLKIRDSYSRKQSSRSPFFQTQQSLAQIIQNGGFVARLFPIARVAWESITFGSDLVLIGSSIPPLMA